MIVSLLIFPEARSSNFLAMTAWCLPLINPGHMVLTKAMKEVCPFSRFTASAYCCAIKRRLSLSPSGRRSIRLIIFSSINLMHSDIRRPYGSGLAGDTFTDSQSNQSFHLPRDITPPFFARKSHDVIDSRAKPEPLPPLINDHIDFLLRRSHFFFPNRMTKKINSSNKPALGKDPLPIYPSPLYRGPKKTRGVFLHRNTHRRPTEKRPPPPTCPDNNIAT